MTGTNMNKVNVEPVDRGDKLRQGIQLRLGLPPVVVRPPIADKVLHLCQLRPLRAITDCFLVRPASGSDPLTEVNEHIFRNVNVERTDSIRSLCPDGFRL